MASISISSSRGITFAGKLSDFTIGTDAPSGGDFEFRYNTADTNSKVITREDLIFALRAYIDLLSQYNQSPAGTPFIGEPAP